MCGTSACTICSQFLSGNQGTSITRVGVNVHLRGRLIDIFNGLVHGRHKLSLIRVDIEEVWSTRVSLSRDGCETVNMVIATMSFSCLKNARSRRSRRRRAAQSISASKSWSPRQSMVTTGVKQKKNHPPYFNVLLQGTLEDASLLLDAMVTALLSERLHLLQDLFHLLRNDNFPDPHHFLKDQPAPLQRCPS